MPLLLVRDPEQMQRIEIVGFDVQHRSIRAFGFGEPTLTMSRHVLLVDVHELQRSRHLFTRAW